MITTLDERKQAQQQWLDLVDGLRNECNRFNTHPAITSRVPPPTLTFKLISETEVRIYLHSQQGRFWLNVIIDPDLFYVKYRAHDEPYTCMVLIDVDEHGAYMQSQERVPDTVEDWANAMINTLIVGYL
jgi:hypothetical protein